MKITGQILKENREKQGLTTNEVALLIKINTKAVVAIEEGDLDSLPSKTFLRGFVRSYAKLLKLDANELLSTFYEEMGSTKPKLAIRDQDNEERRRRALEQSMEGQDSPLIKKLVWGAAGTVAVILIIFVLRQVEKYENESKTSPISPELKAISPISPTIENKETTKVTVIEPAVKAEIKTDKNTIQKKSKENETAQKQVIEETPKEIKKEESSKKVTLKTKIKPKTKKPVLAAQEVILEAFDKITITYKINGSASAKMELKEDDVRIIKGAGKITLSISDGGSVNLVHNGKDLGVPGTIGSPIDLTLQ